MPAKPSRPASARPGPSPGQADPAALSIITYPDPILRRKAAPIDLADPAVRRNVRDVAQRMLELMRDAEGIGLAAPQVGLSWRLFVVNIPPDPDDPDDSPSAELPTSTQGDVIYINPVLSGHRGELEPYEEGCLSLPKVRGDVIRPTLITMTAADPDGTPFTSPGAGLLARCWQHEMDHLDGVLIIDKFTQASRLKARAAVRDLERS